MENQDNTENMMPNEGETETKSNSPKKAKKGKKNEGVEVVGFHTIVKSGDGYYWGKDFNTKYASREECKEALENMPFEEKYAVNRDDNQWFWLGADGERKLFKTREALYEYYETQVK